MSDELKVLEFVHNGIPLETVLNTAAEELKEGNTRHIMVISLDKNGVPCIFCSTMNRFEYAAMSLAAQDLALAALRGHIIEEESGPEGGPAS